MSLIIKNTRMPLVTSTLPPLQDRLAALRISGLQGLYMFEDSNVGSSYTTALDVSGNGNNAAARISGGWVTPTRQSNGILIPAGADTAHCGSVFDTPIPRSDIVSGFTQIAATFNLTALATSGVNYFQKYIGSKNEAVSPNVNSESPEEGLGLCENDFANAGTSYKFPCSIDLSGAFLGLFQTISSYPNTYAGRTNISVFRLNPSAKTLSLDVAGVAGAATSIGHNVAFKSGYVAPSISDTFSFGCFGVYAPAGQLIPTVQIDLIAIYNIPLTDAQVAAAITNIQTVLSKRGITV